jgi:hypothetical protein
MDLSWFIEGKCWFEDDSLGNTNEFTQKILTRTRKQVKFDAENTVILIPTRSEYAERGLSQLLWWQQCDYERF